METEFPDLEPLELWDDLEEGELPPDPETEACDSAEEPE